MLGKDLQRLGVLVNCALSDAANPIAYVIGRHEPQLAAIKLLDEHRRPGRVAARLELARQADAPHDEDEPAAHAGHDAGDSRCSLQGPRARMGRTAHAVRPAGPGQTDGRRFAEPDPRKTMRKKRATVAAAAPSTNGAAGPTCDQSTPATTLATRSAPPLAAANSP